MGYIKFDKNQLINLEYSLRRELLRTNRAGAYSSTTIVNCNTRKYHGLLIVPQPQFGNDLHVLLSSLDETIIQREAEFNLGIHQYANNVYNPHGHRYVRDFESDPIPKITYRVGGVVLTKEMLFSSRENLVLFRYTLVDAHSPTKLKFTPFLAFRNVHLLSKANIDANKKFVPVKNGIQVTLYDGYSPLNLQFSKKPEYTHVPDWYYDIEYTHERLRGYDYHEDLYVPGFFEISIKKGESVICAAGTKEILPGGLKQKFAAEARKRVPRTDFKNCLVNAAEQFMAHREKKTEIIAGYPWFNVVGRDTFMSMPGLLLTRGETATYKAVLNSMISMMNGPFFPNVVFNDHIEYDSVDTQLWFFWSLQKYAEHLGDTQKVWKEYKKVIQLILNAYRNGTWFNIRMQENGLLYAGEAGHALTWMNAVIGDQPVTPRIGNPVEVNALWYNAVMFSLEMARNAKDNRFISKWKMLPELIEKSFVENFWSEEKGYLADYTNGDFKDWAVRPNQILAVSMPYSPLSELQQKIVLDVVESELLTPRGLRTLSPKNPKYKGIYRGDIAERDNAYHQGSVMPWTLGHFADSYLKVFGKSGLGVVKNLYKGFEPVMQDYGIGTISELYDGDPPHTPSGAISQATAVAELLRMNALIETFGKKK